MGPRRVPWGPEGLPSGGAVAPSGGTQQDLPAPPQLCIHAQNGRKCQYVGNCSFAHSPEERDMWTFMKENKSEWQTGQGGAWPCVPSLQA